MRVELGKGVGEFVGFKPPRVRVAVTVHTSPRFEGLGSKTGERHAPLSKGPETAEAVRSGDQCSSSFAESSARRYGRDKGAYHGRMWRQLMETRDPVTVLSLFYGICTHSIVVQRPISHQPSGFATRQQLTHNCSVGSSKT